jgi:VCBS repeat-containing protein
LLPLFAGLVACSSGDSGGGDDTNPDTNPGDGGTDQAPIALDFTSEPSGNPIEDLQWTYELSTSALLSQFITFELINAPKGMEIVTNDEGKPEVRWTATDEHGDEVNVTIRATYDDGTNVLTREQTFVLQVEHVNDKPEIVSEAPLTAVKGSTFSYQLEVNDPDDANNGVDLTYTVKLPFVTSVTPEEYGVTISPTGLLQWQVPEDPTYFLRTPGLRIIVSVTDGEENWNEFGLTAAPDQRWNLRVVDENTAPEFITTELPNAIEDVTYTSVIEVNDPAGVDGLDDEGNPVQDEVSFELVDAPRGMEINASTGEISWTPQENGPDAYTVTFDVVATDGLENDVEPVEQAFSIDVTPVNDAPSIDGEELPNAAVIGEVYSHQLSVTDDDDTNNGTDLTFTLASAPEGMTVSSTGLIEWTPTVGDVTVPVEVQVADGGEDSAAVATVAWDIAVRLDNYAPQISQGELFELTTNEDTLVSTTLSATDADLDTLAWSVLTAATNGVASVNSQGVVEYTSNADFNGSDSFEVTVTDGSLSDSITVNVTINAVNDAPVITSEAVTVATEAQTYTYTATATDVENDVLVWSLTASPEGMTIDSASGEISWTPAGDNASEAITVVVDDGTDTTEQSFVVAVSLINDAPVITEGDSIELSVNEETATTLELNATDIDSPAANLVWSIETQAGNGVATISGSGETQVATYTPSADFTGSDTFVVTVTDGDLSDSITVNVTVADVNDAPVITEGTAAAMSTSEDTANTLTLNATDIDTDPANLSWTIATPAANGTAEVSGTGASQTITYTPSLNFYGTDTFVAQVSDGELFDTILVTVSVGAVNDAPVITSNAEVIATEGEEYSYAVQAMDVDTDVLEFSLTEKPEGMTVNTTTGVITWTPGNAVTSETVTVAVTDGAEVVSQTFIINVTPVNDAPEITSVAVTSATEGELYTYAPTATDIDSEVLSWSLTQKPQSMNIDATTGVITWTPANAVTSAAITLVVSDGELNDTQMFTITVGGVNDAPVITEGETASISTAEDTAQALSLNATDIDGDTISWNISAAAANGVAEVSGTGNSQTVTYTPNADFNGVDTFTVEVTDGIATDSIVVTATIAAVNDAPIVSSNAVTAATEGNLYSYSVVATDVDQDTLEYSLSAAPQGMNIDAQSGVITWTPENNVTQADVTVVVSDGELTATQSFTIAVSATNDAPVFSSVPVTTATEDEAYSYTAVATDADGNTLIYGLSVAPIGMTINSSNGVISWTPVDGVLAENVTVTVTDSIETVEQSFTINVTPVNDAPEITEGESADLTTTEDTEGSITLNATDIDSTTLTWSVATVANDGVALVSGTGASQTVSYTPNADFNGVDTFVVEVSDGTDSDLITVNVTVDAANDAPIITSEAVTTATEDEAYSYTVTATDIDEDTLTFSLVSVVEGMNIDADTGVITWTPANGVTSESVTVEVTDAQLTDTQTFTIEVAAVNDAPEITSTPVTVATEEVEYTYTVVADDIDGDTLEFSLTASPEGMVINSTSGTITWTPANNVDEGVVTVEVTDGQATDTQSFTITVSGVNDAPVITEETASITTAEDTQGSVTLNATDIDGDTINWSISGLATNGVAAVSGSGTSQVVSYTPNADFNGVDTFTVEISDGVATDSIEVTVTVNAVNDSPVFANAASTSAVEGSLYQYTPVITDVDDVNNGTDLTFILVAGPEGMTVSATGVVSWTPPNGVPEANVTLQVADGGEDAAIADSQSWTISVGDVNDAPVITSSALTTATEDVLYQYQVQVTDPDDVNNGTDLTFTLVEAPEGMTVSAMGLIQWTPENNVFSADVTVQVADGGESGALPATQSWMIAVTAVNDAPEITSVAVTTATEDEAYSYTVTANDVDIDTVLTFSLTTAPEGMVINPATGQITWTPGNNVTSENVVVEVSDSEATDTQSFTITVTPVNDAPTITSTANTAATEDEAYSYAVTAEDIDGDNLTFSLTTKPLGMTINANTGAISWTPANNVTSEIVTVQVSDGTLTASQTFTIEVTPVNDAPEITSTAPTGALEDTLYTYDVNATDIDGDTLNYSLTVSPDGMVIAESTGVITWTPANGVTSEPVVVAVTDGQLTVTQSFTITVGATNDAPVITQGEVQDLTLSEDSYAVTSLNATDADGDTLSWSISQQAANGEASIAGTGSGTIQSIGFLGNENFNGTDSFIVTVSDGTETDTITINVTVTAANDAPVINEGETEALSTAEDTEGSLTLTASDVEGDVLTWGVGIPASNGTATVTDGNVSYMPAASFNGSDSFTVVVNDGTDSDTITVNVTVTAENDAPVIDSTPVTVATEDEAYSYTVAATDVDGDILAYSLVESPQGMSINPTTGVITWTPANGVVEESVTVEVTDTQLTATQTFTITVTAVNDAPEITSTALTGALEDTLYTYDVNATDIDGDSLSYSLTVSPDGMVIAESTGVITWTPANGVTSEPVVVAVTDGQLTVTQSFTITVGASNDAPEITDVAPTLTTLEDTLGSVTLNANDIDGDQLTWSVSVPASNGTAVISGNGDSQTATYTPNADFNGSDSFTVQVSDGTATDTVVVNVTVDAVNDAPVVTSTAITTATEDTAYAYTVKATDVDDDTLSYSLSVAPEGMNIDSNTGAITWTPENGVTNEPVTVEVSDASETAVQSFTITVTATNDAPVIDSTPVTVATEDEAYSYTVTATDIDDDILEYSLVTSPAGMNINAETGEITWTPANGVVEESVTVEVTDTQLTDTQTFTISVTPVNDAPEITEVSATIDTDEDNTGSVTLNATDVDGDTITWSIAANGTNGSAVVSGTGVSQTINYTPNADFNGADSFTVQVSDNQATDTLVVNVTVNAANDAPIVTSDAVTTATEDEAYGYTVTASDIDDDILEFSLTVAPEGMSIDSASGAITWTPANGVTTEPVTVQVSDSQETATQSFTITVTPVNDAPVITSTAITGATEAVEYTYTVVADDIDGDTLEFSLTASPAGMDINPTTGVITWTPANGVDEGVVTVEVSDGQATATQSFTITVGAVNDAPVITEGATTTLATDEDTAANLTLNATDADGDAINWSISDVAMNGTATVSGAGASQTVSYTPAANFNGTDSFSVQVSDGTLSDTIVVSVTVNAVADAPVITEGETSAQSTNEDTSSAFAFNATDVDGGTLTWTISSAATNGVATVSGTGVSQTVNYVPDANFHGTDTFVVQISDGFLTDSITVTMTVVAVNDLPVITSEAVTTATEGQVYTYLPAATDVENDTLTWNVGTAPASMNVNSTTGELTWTPANGDASAPVTLIVNDGTGSVTQSFTITVTAVNDAPVITEGESTTVTMDEDATPQAFSLVLNAADADNVASELTWSIGSAATNGSATVSGTGTSKVVNYTPDADFNGDDSFTVTISDGTASDTITVNVTVDAANDAPAITEATATIVTDEDVAGNVTLNATDIDTDAANITWTILTPATKGTASVNASNTGASMLVTYAPNSNTNGADSFVVQISDGELTDTITVDVTVNPVDDAPAIAQGDSVALSTNENTVGSVALNGIDVDTDAANLSWSVTTAATNGVANVTSTGTNVSASYTPNTDFSGSDSFVVELSDGTSTDTITVNVTVNSVNAAPVITNGATAALTTDEDNQVTLSLAATDSDGDSLTWSISSGASQGGVAVDANGLVTYVPALDTNGSDTFTVQVSDAELTDSIDVTVTINPVNDVPVITEGATSTLNIIEDETGSLTFNATDADNDSLTWSLSSGALNGIVTRNGSEFSYTPNIDFNGSDSFTVAVSDDTVSVTNVVTVTVAAVNDAPSVTSDEITSATQGQVYAYDVAASDVEGDAFTFALTTSPSGMQIDVNTGEIRWIPFAAGTETVVVSVSDGSATGTQTFDIVVAAEPAVAGRAVKGVLANALVEAFVYDSYDTDTRDHVWSTLGTTTTDANGYFGFDLGTQTKPVRIRVTTNASTTMVCDAPSGCLLSPPAAFGESGAPAEGMILDAIVSGADFAGPIAVTPMTHMAATWLQAFPQALDDNNVLLGHRRLAKLFGFNDETYVNQRAIDLTDSFEVSQALNDDEDRVRHAIFAASLQETAVVAGLSIDSVAENVGLIFGLLGGQMPLKSGVIDVSTLNLVDESQGLDENGDPILFTEISYTGFDTFIANAKTVGESINDGSLTTMINGFDALVTDWTPELADPSDCLVIDDADLDRSACRNITTIGEATGFDQANFDRAVAPIDVVGAYLDSAKAAEAGLGDQTNRDLGWLYVDATSQAETAEMLSGLSTLLGYAVQTSVCVPQFANGLNCSITPAVGYEALTTSITDCQHSSTFRQRDESCTLTVSGTINDTQSFNVTSRVPDVRTMLGGSRFGPPDFTAGPLPLCFNGYISNNVAKMDLSDFCVILNVSDSREELLTPFENLNALAYADIGTEGSTAYIAMQNLLEEVVLEVGATGGLSLISTDSNIGTYTMSNMDMSFTFDRESISRPEKGTPVFDFEVTSYSSTNLWGETVSSISNTPMFKLQVDDTSFLTGSKLTDNVGVPPVLSVTNVTINGLKPIVDVLKDYALGLVSFSEDPNADPNTAPPVVTAEQWEQIIAEVEAGLVYGGTITSTIQENVVDESGSNVFQTYVVELTSDGSVFVSNLNDNTDLNSETAAMQIYLSGATGYIYAGETLVATAHLGNSQDGMLLSFADGTQRSYTNANPSATSQLDSFFDFITILFPSAEEGTTTN